jgi:hypothetical protein
VALAFAIHPVNVDSVAWVATRSNLLVTLFSLGAMLLYVPLPGDAAVAAPGPRRRAVRARGAVQVAGVVLPLTLFLIDYRHRTGWSWRLLLDKIPFFLIAGAIGWVTLLFRDDMVNPHHYNWLDRVVLICAALVAYLIRLFWPFDLALAYEYPPKDGGHLPGTSTWPRSC